MAHENGAGGGPANGTQGRFEFKNRIPPLSSVLAIVVALAAILVLLSGITGNLKSAINFLWTYWEVPVFLALIACLIWLLAPSTTRLSSDVDRVSRPENFRQAQQARLATFIIAGSLLLILLVGAVVLLTIAKMGQVPFLGLSETEKTAALKDILFAILPLAGTWVGTVLAFYFSANNFQAAAEQSRELYQVTTGRITGPNDRPIRELMRKREELKPVIFQDWHDKPLSDLVAEIGDRSRVVLLHSEDPADEPKAPGSGIGVIHKGDFKSALADAKERWEKAKIADPNATIDTLKEALEVEPFKRKVKSARVLKPDAPLKQAVAMGQENRNCRDFFISRTGSRDGRLIGWVTDEQIAEAIGAITV